MNLNKHLEFIQPSVYNKPIHIIGVGAIGSRVAEVLTRLGFDDLHIYDFDIVEDANVTNQLYVYPDLGKPKTDALEAHLKTMNPSLRLTKYGAYEKQPLIGTVFLCVDSIETRRRIVERHLTNARIDVIIDIRMRLTDGQAYFADWQDAKSANILYSSMQFNDKDDLTPLSVCGSTLSVAPTILTLVSSAIMNFMAYIKKAETKQVIFLDLMTFSLNAFNYK